MPGSSYKRVYCRTEQPVKFMIRPSAPVLPVRVDTVFTTFLFVLLIRSKLAAPNRLMGLTDGSESAPRRRRVSPAGESLADRESAQSDSGATRRQNQRYRMEQEMAAPALRGGLRGAGLAQGVWRSATGYDAPVYR